MDTRYYIHLAAAFVRGKMPELSGLSDSECVERGREAGLKVHKFKRTSLPRVHAVLGLLRSIHAQQLLDVGSGRGAFLWPLLEAFPELPVMAVDQLEYRADDINAVARGGVERLEALAGDLVELDFTDKMFDAVTVLEVLEHQRDPLPMARRCVELAQRFVIASVPSRPDNNPEHVQLFDSTSMTVLFEQAGARKVSVQYVLNHMVALVSV